LGKYLLSAGCDDLATSAAIHPEFESHAQGTHICLRNLKDAADVELDIVPANENIEYTRTELVSTRYDRLTS
jgi:predicted AAA+ superfamily ATPase